MTARKPTYQEKIPKLEILIQHAHVKLFKKIVRVLSLGIRGCKYFWKNRKIDWRFFDLLFGFYRKYDFNFPEKLGRNCSKVTVDWGEVERKF